EPADGDPMRIEANGYGNRNEADRQREVQKVQGCCSGRITLAYPHLPAQKNVYRRKSQREPCYRCLIYVLQHRVDLQKIDRRIQKGNEIWNCGRDVRFPLLALPDQRRYRKNSKEQRGKSERYTQLLAR